MSGFDPAAATAAYMATLSPAAHAKATAYTQGGHWLLLWGTLVSVLVGWLVLRSGILQRTQAGIERKRPHPWRTVAAIVVIDGILEGLLNVPWDSYANWWREKGYGLTSQPFVGWLVEHLMGMAIGLVATVVVFSVLYWIIRRAPKTWWLWGGILTAGFFFIELVISPILIEPLFNQFTPAPPGPVRDTVMTMAKQVGVPSDKIFIYDGSKQSNRYTANVAGILGSARVAMSDVMFQKNADIAEVRGVVGHEMGHYVRNHALWLTLGTGLLALITYWLVDRLFQPVVNLTGAKGINGIADPAGLPVIGIIMSVATLLLVPLNNTLTRLAEADADHFSVVHFNEPDGLAKALVKTIEYRASSPSALEEFLFYDHPSVEHRVRAMMDWKATHPPTPAPKTP